MKLLGEIKVHKSMDHPNIVRQRDCFEDEVNVYMILDICTNGTLMEMLRNRKRFTEPETRYFGLQILGAAKYMHSRRVIHRDLKLGNLFLDEEMCIKVGDFGLAALLVDDDDRKKTICGTPNYIAPEVLFGSAEGHSYEVDLWSIGVIFYAMLIGKPPFQSKDVKAIYAKIKTNEYEFPSGLDISSDARDLITNLLSTDPENRPSIDDIARHAFFNSGVMPRSIPSSAVKSLPDFPSSQSSSTFRRNLAYVTGNAGIGLGHCVGREPGKSVDVIVEKPESGRYLPVSISPRTGPAAKMVSLQSERSAGRKSTLSDRLSSVKLDEAHIQQDTWNKRDEMAHTDMRRATLNAGALRPMTLPSHRESNTPKYLAADVDKPLPEVREAELDQVASNTQESKVTRPRGLRMTSEPSRPITRSARFTQTQGSVEHHRTSNQAQPVLGGPARRSVSSSTVPTLNSMSSQPASRTSIRRQEPENINSASPGTTRTVAHGPRSRLRSGQCLETRASHEVPSSSPPPKISIRTTVNSSTRMCEPLTSTPGTSWQATRRLCVELERALDRSSSRRPSDNHHTTPILYISKWVDYSHRYGLGYQLSNENTGVYFNDLSSIILAPASPAFTYISSNASDTYPVESPPKELEKKVYLLKHFKSYMTAHLNGIAQEPEDTQDAGSKTYMTHYQRSKTGMLFRLSDGTIQINYTDHSKLMIPSDLSSLRYVDTLKNVSCTSVHDAIGKEECREKVALAVTMIKTFLEVARDDREADGSPR